MSLIRAAEIADEDRHNELKVQQRRARHPSSRIRVDAATQLGDFGPATLPTLLETLADEHPDVRIAAINSLAQVGMPLATDQIVPLIHDDEPEVRERAAEILAEADRPLAISALAEAMSAPDQEVAISAAKALGRIGDVQAVPHLMKAHRRCFVGRSARRQFLIGLVIVGCTALLIGGLIWGSMAAKFGGLFVWLNVIIRLVGGYFDRRKKRSALAAAIADALLQIAERSSSPEIHRIVPELRTVARDSLQHAPETRDAAREAARRIDALTGKLQQLPVAATDGQESAEEALPIPADRPE